MMLERRLRLPADPMSVRRAREHVGAVLREAGREDWVDDAEQSVSEVVTNVVLHARTSCELSVRVNETTVRVGVRDFSPTLPTQRHFSQYATTGRGLLLVSWLAADYGIKALGPLGKIVWFVLDDVRRGTRAGPPDQEWDLTGLVEDEADPGTSQALLAQVPMALWLVNLEHQAAVLRELYLLTAASPQPAVEFPVDLVAAGTALRTLSAGTDRALEESADQPALPRLAPLPDGHPAVLPSAPAVLDVSVPTGPEDSAVFGAFQEALDLGARLARQGRMLARPALDELIALRGWACDQVIAQGSGVPPTPWSASGARLAQPSNATHERPDWDDTAVRTSERAVVAADDSNRLIAVSAAAAELVGRTPQALVGRRVTTIIPVRLREQHVAGFTRHLTTGETNVLGVDLHLPVLRADGQEVMRRFLIEQVAAPAGRRVYVAWLDPLPDGDTDDDLASTSSAPQG